MFSASKGSMFSLVPLQDDYLPMCWSSIQLGQYFFNVESPKSTLLLRDLSPCSAFAHWCGYASLMAIGAALNSFTINSKFTIQYSSLYFSNNENNCFWQHNAVCAMSNFINVPFTSSSIVYLSLNELLLIAPMRIHPSKTHSWLLPTFAKWYNPSSFSRLSFCDTQWVGFC